MTFATPLLLWLLPLVGVLALMQIVRPRRPADLAIGSLRTDVIDTITAGSSGSLDAQLNLFVGRPAAEGGRFQRPVALVHRLSLKGDALRSRGRLLARFLHDVDGNGLVGFSDLIEVLEAWGSCE